MSEATESQALLTVHDLAELLGMSEAWIRKGILERSLPFTKLGRSVRFTPDQISAIIQFGERSPITNRPSQAHRGSARTRL